MVSLALAVTTAGVVASAGAQRSASSPPTPSEVLDPKGDRVAPQLPVVENLKGGENRVERAEEAADRKQQPEKVPHDEPRATSADTLAAPEEAPRR